MQEKGNVRVREDDYKRYQVIAGLVTDILFEYDFATGQMLNCICSNG